MTPEARLAGLNLWVTMVAADLDTLEDKHLIGLSEALSDVPIRDAALIHLVPGAQGTAEAMAAEPYSHKEGIDTAMARMIHGTTPPPPVAHSALALLDRVATMAPEATRAGAAALGAYVAWWLDDVRTAQRLISTAQAVDANHRLALLTQAALTADMRPAWRQATPVT